MSKYKQGDIVSGYVTGIEKYGIFICIDDKYSGLIHISEISSNFVKNVHDYVKIGEIINAKVLEDEKNGQIKLTIKDIDYRISSKKSNKIVETSTGFSTLLTMLNKWIERKMSQNNKKTKKN